MEFKQSERLNHFKTGIFSALTSKAKILEAEGKKVYNLFVGTPDFKPQQHIIDAVCEAAKNPENYKYSLLDMPEMLNSVKNYYSSRYGVSVETDCITSVNGSQEGMGHIGLALCNKGDYCLLPNPGYPVFEAGSYFGEATLYYYPLVKENNFLPKISEIPTEILEKTKYIILSYPSNPVGAAAPKEMYVEMIEYAKKYGFIIINDNAYSDIVFDDREGFSFLSIEGASDVGIEFFSLSKSFNVTGARISFALGNKSVIDALKLMRSQYDFGMFYPVQQAAIAALNGPRDAVKAQCLEYQQRRDALCDGLDKYGWHIPRSGGTMFVWAPLPDGYTDCLQFCDLLIEKAGVVCTPGVSFGSMGEGYVRFALVMPASELSLVAEAIGKSGILNK